MRLERKSLLACTLLLLTGCSAVRHFRSTTNEGLAPDRVPLPVRHADEYDTDEDNYDYQHESSPSHEDDSLPPRSNLPPAAPMREPVPAPPAIGVSRVKSVSWLRRSESNSLRNTCGDQNNVDGCTTGNCSPLPPSYFEEGCDTQPQATRVPALRDREKTNLVEVVRGWHLKKRTRPPQQTYAPRNCGEQTAASPGCYAPDGCTQNVPPRHRNVKSDAYLNPNNSAIHNGSLAEPLTENGCEEKSTHRNDAGFSPDELMELPSNLQQPPESTPQLDINPQPRTKPQSVPHVPNDADLSPTSQLPTQLPGNPDVAAPAAVEQQVNPNSVNSITRPPMWPRLGQPAPKTANLLDAAPMLPQDSSLPLVQPGRRI